MQVVRELLSKLVSIPSINPMGRPANGPEFLEAKLTDFLEAWLAPLEVELRRQPVSPGRDNLLATMTADSPNHVLLEVHQDTVPVEGMEIDPFAAEVREGRLFGRGACDNKGPMTAMLLALARLARERPAGSANVTLALTVDEEFTFTGVQKLVDDGIGATCAVVAEPTEMDIVIAHKGAVRWKIVTRGTACHSSTPAEGENAIYRMTGVLAALERYAGELAVQTTDMLLGGPTMSVGRIDGGISVNVVPDRCEIEIDRRLIPGETPTSAMRDVKRFLARELNEPDWLAHEPPWLALSPMDARLNRPLAEGFGRALARSWPRYKTKAVPYGTDAHAIAAAGIPAIVFGPGSIAQAHTKDEWIDLDQIALAADVYFDFCSRADEYLAPVVRGKSSD